jgi:hypothetical protein
MSNEERKLLDLLASRHNNIYNQMVVFATGAADLQALAGQCSRELLIEEWRNIASEYIFASKCFFTQLGITSHPRFPFLADGVPLEIASAQMFHMHHTALNGEVDGDCPTPSALGGSYSRQCLVGSSNIALVKQHHLSVLSAAQFDSSTQAQVHGLGSVDDYVTKLGAPFSFATAVNLHLLLGLRDTVANYAINVGILESLLEEQNTVRNATASCLEFASAISQSALNAMTLFVSGPSQIPRFTTISEVLNSVGGGPLGRAAMFYANGQC